MTAIIISSILIVGIVLSLIKYINKGWIERHVYKEIDPNDNNF
jgi:hypothetical protein